MVFGLDSHSWWVLKMIFAVLTGCLTISGAVIGFLIVDRGEPNSKIWFNKVWERVDQSSFLTLPETCIGFLLRVKQSLLFLPLKRIINDKVLSGLLVAEFLILAYLVWSGVVLDIENPLFEKTRDLLFLFYDWSQGILESFWPAISIRWKAAILYTIAGIIKRESSRSENSSSRGDIFIFIINMPFLILVELPATLFIIYLFFAALYVVFFSTNILLSILFIALLSVLLLSGKRKDDKNNIFLLFTTINLTYLSFLFGDVFSVDPADYQPRTFQALAVNTSCDFLTVYLTFTIFERFKNIRRKSFHLLLLIVVVVAGSAILCVISLYFSLYKTSQTLTIVQCLHVFIGQSDRLGHFNLGSLFWFMHSSFIPVLVYILIVMVAWVAKINLLPLRWLLGRAAINEQPLKLTGAFIAIFIAVFGLCTVISNELSSRAKDIAANDRIKKTAIIISPIRPVDCRLHLRIN